MMCSCGNHQENIKSFFHKESKLRVTVCDDCADKKGMTDKKLYDSVEYDKLSIEQNKTPEPNAVK